MTMKENNSVGQPKSARRAARKASRLISAKARALSAPAMREREAGARTRWPIIINALIWRACRLLPRHRQLAAPSKIFMRINVLLAVVPSGVAASIAGSNASDRRRAAASSSWWQPVA